MKKLQIVYTGKPVAHYMESVHQDDKASGTLVRLWDHPGEGHDCAMLVMPPHIRDLSVDLVLEEVHAALQDVTVQPIYVTFDGADNAMWITQDDDMVKVRTADQAVTIAMRLLLWAQFEQNQPTKEEI